jgi:DNA primase
VTNRAQRAAERIREEIPILDVLVDYGYAVHPDGGDREQQFSCDLHGDGSDTKPSARVYPDSASWFCFACGRTRDAIATVREKEGVSFWKAVRGLESRFGLPPLPWEPSEQETAPQTTLRVREALDQSVSYTEHARRVSRFLENLCEERSCRPPQAAAFWEVFDKVEYLVSKSEMKEADAIRTLNKILERSKQVASRGAAT